LKTNYN